MNHEYDNDLEVEVQKTYTHFHDGEIIVYTNRCEVCVREGKWIDGQPSFG
jgi:hypothetical protein